MSFELRTEYQDRTTAEAYDSVRFSSWSGRVFQWAERRALRRILRRLPPSGRILDAPCGTGRLMDLFLARGFDVLGADISGEMMEVARCRAAGYNGRVSFARLDLLSIALAARSVVGTASIRFLPHVPPEERVLMLREFGRVSRRWVLISISHSSPWHRCRRWVKAWLGHPKSVRYPITNDGLTDELRQAGLREVRRVRTFPVLSEEVLLLCERA